MFKEGQVYKVKVELTPGSLGFGRAKVLTVDSRGLLIELKSSTGKPMDIDAGAKIWFVGSSLNSKFNGLWSSEVKSSRMSHNALLLECKTPRFEQSDQRRNQARIDLTANIELRGTEWLGLRAPVVTRNISRHGIAFSVQAECAELFCIGRVVNMRIPVGNSDVDLRGRVVESRFNWLLNRTDVGAELIDLDAATTDSIERILVWLGNRPKGTKSLLSESGSLARWMKAGKNDLSKAEDMAEAEADDLSDGEAEDLSEEEADNVEIEE